MKYLVHWKGFTAENDIQKKEEDLENVKEIVDKFKEKLRVEVRRQGKLEIAEENNLRREELPGKYTVKILFG